MNILVLIYSVVFSSCLLFIIFGVGLIIGTNILGVCVCVADMKQICACGIHTQMYPFASPSSKAYFACPSHYS